MARLQPLWFLFVSVWATAVAVGMEAIDPNNPPQGRFSDEWGEVYLADRKIGYSHSTLARENDHIRTATTVYLEIKRADQGLTVRSEESTTETLTGIPITFGSTMDMSIMKSATKGTVKEGKVTIVQSQFGMEQTQTFNYPDGALMTWGTFRESLVRGFEPGTQYSIPVYAPQLRLDAAITAVTEIGQWEEFEHRGKRRRGLNVKVAMESPVGALTIVSWVDRNGRPLKARVPTPGIGNLEIIATDQATALADFVPPELFLKTVIPVDGAINRDEAWRVRYRITAKSDEVDLGELPGTDMQTIAQQTDRSIEVLIRRQKHHLETARDAKKPLAPPAEYLEGNLMINTEDPRLTKLARKAADGETEPFALGDKLRRFVTDYVTAKSLNVGFGTASEVARSREGDCSEHGVLLAALGRINGLPARVAVGVVYLPVLGEQANVFGYHMWTQFFIDGRWIDFDAALRESECSPTRIAFATSSLKNTGLADLSLPLLSKLGAIDIEILEVETAKPVE